MNRLRATSVLIAALVAGCPTVAAAHAHDGSVTKFFSDVTVGPDETVAGDLNVVLGNATIAGHVNGNVNVLGGGCEVVGSGSVDGDEHCVWNDGLRALAPLAASSAGLGRFAQIDRRLLVKLASSAVVVLIFLLFPLRMRLALDRVERHPGIAAAAGAIACIAFIPLAILLLFSLVGIPLIPLAAAAVLAGMWLGSGAVALLVGRRLCELALPRVTPSPLMALILGLTVVDAAEVVPILGWAVTALVWLVGFGAAILSFVPQALLMRMRLGTSPAARAPVGGPPMRTLR